MREAVTRLTALATASVLMAGAWGCGGSDNNTGKESASFPANAPVPSSPELASNQGPIIVGGHAIIRQGAVGPLRVGEWRRPVMSFVYVVGARSGRDSVSIIVVRGIGKDTVTLAFSNDTLRSILVTRPGARTSDGIEVGAPFATVAGRSDATTVTRGTARVASIRGLCGVKFATDSAALSSDSAGPKGQATSDTIRAISIDLCKS